MISSMSRLAASCGLLTATMAIVPLGGWDPESGSSGFWGRPGGYPEVAKALRSRLTDVLAYEDDVGFLLAWNALSNDLGIDDRFPMRLLDASRAGVGYGYELRADSLSRTDAWHLVNWNIAQAPGDAPPDPEGSLVPKQPSLAFIGEEGVSFDLPPADQLPKSVLFVSMGDRAVIIDFRYDRLTLTPLADFPSESPRAEIAAMREAVQPAR